ncbi:hypothetical protein Desca_1631 [Desulfotomaculum nigrificans CO-1-SRB]|uniref:Uncharacterized protein n=2 Tax=Eubacteriales TaxID=186802 RepID=F6B754_DESCC|nr:MULTISPECIES: hypothetical protein [Eubacteriales]AEF94479.1 hypothetical protein Desca_1631 [Desulfotomaculum nigrificans CO-1-SRB]AQS59633.1 hypothetical protein B0537_11420 [Desulforamulus ferrireducens]SHH44361.1 hypothetical protein SAMN02745177_02568 [Desulforamulus hydrothermalis Lam5 = DSM 18033]
MSKKHILIFMALLFLAAQPISNVLANFYSYEKTTAAKMPEPDYTVTQTGEQPATKAGLVTEKITSQPAPTSQQQKEANPSQGATSPKTVAPVAPAQVSQPAAKPPQVQHHMEWQMDQAASGHGGSYYSGYRQMGSPYKTDYEWYQYHRESEEMGNRQYP